MGAAGLTIWTIGHSTRPIEEFVGMLRANGIERLVDVRSHPGSRRHPQFGKDALSASLGAAGIEYVHMPELGGRRKARADSPNTAWRNESFRGYADYTMTEEFGAGLARLIEMAGERPTAIMCAEALWWQCHRGLIADALKVRGARVLHIAGDRAPAEHPYTSAASVVDGRLSYAGAAGEKQSGLFEGEEVKP